MSASAAVIGAVIGGVWAVWNRADPLPLRTASLAGGVIAAILTALGAPGAVIAAIVGLSVGAALVGSWWRSRPGPHRRAASLFDDRTQRSIVAHQLVGAWPWWVTIVAAAVGLSFSAGVDGLAGWVAPVAAVGIAAALRSDRAVVPKPQEPVLGENGVDVLVVAGGDRLESASLAVWESSSRTAIVPAPPVVFRGLVGWNLGLGLGAEQAAWASQLAADADLTDLLADPEWALDDDRRFLLAFCRALAANTDHVVVEVSREVTSSEAIRRAARLAAEHRGGRRLTIVCDDEALGRGFATRVLSGA